jgi:hypothetical protein
VALAQRTGDGSGLDELRPVADDGEDAHAGSVVAGGPSQAVECSLALA